MFVQLRKENLKKKQFEITLKLVESEFGSGLFYRQFDLVWQC